MLRHKVITILAVSALGLGFEGLVQPAQPAAAQSVYQKIPKRYRGTWHLKHATWKVKKGGTIKIKARSFESAFGSYKGKQLGVHVAKKHVSLFQIAGGQQVGEFNNLQRTRYKNKAALKWTFDAQTAYYVKG
ncbi:hypothetical protein [Levilactobacillus cerevisiae]|uniref:hypothetical protein n=1 Tax=Levilactobacillus cerevisiae TaxID=1704076 RepID=UPI000F76908B|nr:hypothetical protein [Levilactobacillus cerevisiae]